MSDYPTHAELTKIRKWPPSDDWGPLMAYVRSLWWSENVLWHEGKRRIRPWPRQNLVRRYQISTGGWSGNEDIIDAMQRNQVFWMMCWQSHRRGGHYEFHV